MNPKKDVRAFYQALMQAAALKMTAMNYSFAVTCELVLMIMLRALRDCAWSKQRVIKTFTELADVVYKEKS